MGEFADYTLDEVMDAEDDRLEYRTGKMSLEKALELGIVDELGREISNDHESPIKVEGA